MQDKYFKTTESKEDIIDALNLDAGNVITGCGGNYFQTPAFILFWVGKIPITDPETGEITGYEADGAEHFNVRPITGYPDLGELDIEEIHPNTPYAVFQ
jgi:hypothetical protein